MTAVVRLVILCSSLFCVKWVFEPRFFSSQFLCASYSIKVEILIHVPSVLYNECDTETLNTIHIFANHTMLTCVKHLYFKPNLKEKSYCSLDYFVVTFFESSGFC